MGGDVTKKEAGVYAGKNARELEQWRKEIRRKALKDLALFKPNKKPTTL